MQVPRTARAGLIDFQRLVEQGTNEIAQHWREAMRADAAAPASESVKEPLLLDAVPFVLDQVLCFIESNESKIDPENICRVARRNRGKVREHFDVRQLVREYQLLREYTLLYLHEHVAQFSIRDRSGMTTTYRRAGLAMDQAMRETINAFVEEHTGQLRHVSRTDNLTGLYDHYTFNERLGEELTRAKRYENPLAIVLSMLVWTATLWLSGYVSVASLAAAVPFPLWVRLTVPRQPYTLCASVILALLIVYAHRANIRRLRDGTENRFRTRKGVGRALRE